MNNRDKKEQSEIVYGVHAVKSLLLHNRDSLDAVYLIKQKQKEVVSNRIQEIVSLATSANISLMYLTKEEFLKSPYSSSIDKDSVHQNIFALKSKKNTKSLDFKSWLNQQNDKDRTLVLVLDQVTDPHNLGACIRTADAAGVDLIVTPKDNSANINATVRKVAAGAADSVALIQVNNIVRALNDFKADGYWIYGLSDQADKSIFEHEWPNKCAVVMGAEGQGMRRLVSEECDELLAIPMLGVVESLNVSVATGVVLFDIRKQFSR